MNMDQAELTIERILSFQQDLCDLLVKVYDEAGLISNTKGKIVDLWERIRKTREVLAKYGDRG